MCPDCSREWLAWLDYRVPPPAIQLISIGNKAREVNDRREGRLRDWRATIRFQQGLIRQLCAEGGHAAQEPAPSPARSGPPGSGCASTATGW